MVLEVLHLIVYQCNYFEWRRQYRYWLYLIDGFIIMAVCFKGTYAI